jgi:hypothetical protein
MWILFFFLTFFLFIQSLIIPWSSLIHHVMSHESEFLRQIMRYVETCWMRSPWGHQEIVPKHLGPELMELMHCTSFEQSQTCSIL